MAGSFRGGPAESDAIRRVAATVMPLEHVDFNAGIDEGVGDATIAIRVYATTRDEARQQAGYLLRRMLDAAGLSAPTIRTLGHISPSWRNASIASDIAREAHELHKQGRHELAIIRIQTACELEIEHALAALLAVQHPQVDPARMIRRSTTLRDDASQALVHLLTAKKVQSESWWPDYVEHLKRRHEIVHRGVAVTRDDSYASLEVNIQLHRWLLEARGVDETGLDDIA